MNPERQAALKEHFARVERAILEQERELAKRSEASSARPGDLLRKAGLAVKSDSESSSPKSSPKFQHQRLSLVEERRRFFQRRHSTASNQDSGDTVIAVTVVDEDGDEPVKELSEKKARQISVRKFDTFSTFEGTFDEDTGLGYLAGIEEDKIYRQLDSEDKRSESFHEKMTQAMAEAGAKTPAISQESPVRTEAFQ